MANMTESFVIEEKTFSVKRSAFEGLDVLAGIDRGCSLTKVLYATPGNTDDTYTLHTLLCANADFEKILLLLANKKLIKLGKGDKLKVTGAGCDKHKDMIKEKLGMELEFVDEFVTMVAGVHWLMSNMSMDDICYNDDDKAIDLTLYKQKSDNPEAEKLSQQWQVDSGAEDSTDSCFPCLYGLMGSGGGFLLILPNGQCRLVSGVGLAGKTFLGFAKLLLGTSDYDEILRLASAGKRGNVDNEGRDLLLSDVDTPYGKMPPSMPIFPFGKAVDKELSRSDCNREDLAHSLVAAFAANLFNLMCTSAKLSKTNRVLLGGNFFKHPFIRQEVLKQQYYFEMHSISIRFLRTGHGGAVGAMIGRADETGRVLFAED